MTDRAIPAVIYGAKSTGDDKGSIPTQLEDCEAMAEREHWDVVGEFRDEGFSAYSGNRGPGLAAAIERAADAARERGACMLVAQHSDRFARGDGRKARHLGGLYFDLLERSVQLRSVQDDDNLRDAIRAVLMGERNTEDSRRKSEATRAGKRRRAERGESTGPLAFGYRLAPRPDGEGKLRLPHPDEAPVVLRMFEMLDEGQSVGEITRWLNARGVKTKRGNTFGRSRVAHILGNPYYGGKVRAYGELVDGKHDALMPWAEFERISAKLAGRSSPAARRGGRPSTALLSGVLVCAHCGHGVWHRGDGRRRYVCGNVRHATGACDAAPFDAATADRMVVEHLDSLFLDFEGWLASVDARQADQRDALLRRLSALASARDGLDRDEGLLREDYRARLRAGEDRKADLALTELEAVEAQRGELAEKIAGAEARLAEWDERSPADDCLDFWSDLRDSVQREIVGADSVQAANAALRERFSAIVAWSRPGGEPRLHFELNAATFPEGTSLAELYRGWDEAGQPEPTDDEVAEWEYLSHPPVLAVEGGRKVKLTKVNRCLAEGRARLRQLGAMD